MDGDDPISLICGRPANAWSGQEGWAHHRLSYASYVSLKHRYAYVETPKVACTTIKTFLFNLEGFDNRVSILSSKARVSDISLLIHDRSLFDMPSLADLDAALAQEILEDPAFFKFCFVRNPFSRLASAWKDKVNLTEPGYEGLAASLRQQSDDESTEISFASFVKFICGNPSYPKDEHWEPQTNLVFDQAIPYTMIGRLEEFGTDFSRFTRHLQEHGVDLSSLSPSTLHSTGGKNWQRLYDPELASLAFAYMKDDFLHFGYDGASWSEPCAAATDDTIREIKRLRGNVHARNRMITLLYNRIDEIEEKIAMK